jgi:SAM-dependent methyltransferase
MDERDVRRHWDANADTWTRLSRAGYDIYRDGLNTPAFMAMLPDIAGRRGLDVGCGEGHNTRLLAARGAPMTAVDLSAVFLAHARRAQATPGPPVRYVHASAASLPFGDAAFDFATAFMSLMDMHDSAAALAEVRRVLRPGGFFQFSIEHPSYKTPHRRNLRDASGLTYAYEIGDYFRIVDGQIDEWTFSAAPADIRAAERPFRIPRFARTLSGWCNLLVETGFSIERCEEPRPSDDTVRKYPKLQDTQVLPYFLHVRVRR